MSLGLGHYPPFIAQGDTTVSNQVSLLSSGQVEEAVVHDMVMVATRGQAAPNV
jgi:hypothetical protein